MKKKRYKRVMKNWRKKSKNNINRKLLTIGGLVGTTALATLAIKKKKDNRCFKREEQENLPLHQHQSYGDRHVYFIGGGLASLAGAAYLIRDCHFKGENIHIIEGLPVLGGSNDGAGSKSEGFVCRGGRMLNEETYENFWELFSSIPSLDMPGKTVTEEILNFDHHHPTHAQARLVDKDGKILDVKSMGFNQDDRMALAKLMMTPEEKLDDQTIEDWFAHTPHFFETNFWYMWETTFAFRTQSSAQELRRYMHQMIYEFTQIEHLVGVNRTRYNQQTSIMMPLIDYLQKQGCQIVLNRRVTDWNFKDTPMQDEITVTGLEMENVETGEHEHVDVDDDTAVFFTNGSITDSATLGDFNTPAPENMDYGAASSLWKKATEHFYNLGNPDKFFADRNASEWVSYTVTTKNHLLINEITRITTQVPGNALNSFISTEPITPLGQKDVNTSIVVHHQPHFTTQKPNESVIWGYFLYPRRRGEFVDKQYIKMTGKEMLEELIGQLSKVDPGPVNIMEKKQAILDSVINCIPVYMPYASALFNNRAKSDRPEIIPEHSTNLAFTGEFVEQPYQMIFTEESAVRSGEIAAYYFAGVSMDKLVKTPRYDKDPKTLLKAARKMFE